MTSLGLAVAAGLVLALGLVALVVGLTRSAPRLADALDLISPDEATAPDRIDLGPVVGRSERLGAWLYRRTPIPLTTGQRRLLRLQGKSVAEFYADKAVMAIVGAVVPAAAVALLGLGGGHPIVLPALVSVVGAVLGFMVPDLLLRQRASGSRTHAVESLLLFIDLITLERLANASSTQALRQAATLSDVLVFRQIRAAVERAGLEQQAPYAELRRLADQLDLPELVDIADVMQLDESGAALSGSLRARVKELRDAHLNREQAAASAAVEGMTVFMTLPAIIFGMIFMAAALLTLTAT